MVPMVRPPPIPPSVPKSSRWKVPLIVIGVIVGLLIVFGIQIAFWIFSAREFEPSTSQKESVIRSTMFQSFFLSIRMLERKSGIAKGLLMGQSRSIIFMWTNLRHSIVRSQLNETGEMPWLLI